MGKPLVIRFDRGFGEDRAIFKVRYINLPFNSLLLAPSDGFALISKVGEKPSLPLLSGQKKIINRKGGLFRNVGLDKNEYEVIYFSLGSFGVKASTNFPFPAKDINVRRVKYFLRANAAFCFDPVSTPELVQTMASYHGYNQSSLPASYFRPMVEKALTDVMTEVGAKTLSKKGLSGAYENVAAINREVTMLANRELSSFGLKVEEVSVRLEEEDEVSGKIKEFDLSQFD